HPKIGSEISEIIRQHNTGDKVADVNVFDLRVSADCTIISYPNDLGYKYGTDFIHQILFPIFMDYF
ncbi:hypothetical protein WUBG_17175, partial [Wuchereria bancrofti]